MRLDYLKRRAELAEATRSFFRQRGFLEVETPAASRESIPERHIELLALAGSERLLQASPEMHHKRLLCAGSGPIFEFARVFRGGERGERHHPEFTMLEWYRPGDDLRAGMALLDELLQTVLGAEPAQRTSYRDAFWRHTGVDPISASVDSLRAAAHRLGATSNLAEPNPRVDTPGGDRDEWLNLLLSLRVEPELGRGRPELLYHYPASQCALAVIATDALGVDVAERFEAYVEGVELANGYHELTDADELRERLVSANDQRVAQGLPTLPLPERLLAAMRDPGLPPCAGVALGFDRLVMIATGAKTIGEVTAFCE